MATVPSSLFRTPWGLLGRSTACTEAPRARPLSHRSRRPPAAAEVRQRKRRNGGPKAPGPVEHHAITALAATGVAAETGAGMLDNGWDAKGPGTHIHESCEWGGTHTHTHSSWDISIDQPLFWVHCPWEKSPPKQLK